MRLRSLLSEMLGNIILRLFRRQLKTNRVWKIRLGVWNAIPRPIKTWWSYRVFVPGEKISCELAKSQSAPECVTFIRTIVIPSLQLHAIISGNTYLIIIRKQLLSSEVESAP
jgi:hypothetical protein